MLLSYSPNVVLVRSVNIITPTEAEIFIFALNIIYLDCEFFLNGALGFGLNVVAPNLVDGGSSPIGVTAANLGPLVKDLMSQIGYNYVGHLRAVKRTVSGGIARPLLNISSATFAELYSWIMPLVEDNLCLHLIPMQKTPTFCLQHIFFLTLVLLLLAGLLGVEAGIDAVIRTLLYERRDEIVTPMSECGRVYKSNLRS
ncbi:hypothetical protein PIB30_068543 [Stylosanthes scabra]|uniref:Uncharacterized protein n=1 Tax=Stylosanthes scabra TaxID=79078 RepID=A0ABU6XNM7_9FABA|nr:hypothetical protein [Stylosanthes scabra]